MALSIRKHSVEVKARELATRCGTTMTGAIEQALDAELSRRREFDEAEFERAWGDIRQIQKAYAALGSSGLSEQDIMGWDKNGLPT